MMAGVRVELDNRNETIGKKIREAQLEKIPYSLIIGEKEEAENAVAVRKRSVGDQGTKSLAEFIEFITDEIKNKTL
jgi:threonyl-tRNA synthetase